MNEKNTEMTPQAEESKGGAPQDLSVLAAEVSAMERKAAAGWKITAVFFGILILVIAGYLYFLVYRKVADMLEPETIVQLVIGRVDDVLATNFGAPGLDSGGLPRWTADTLKEKTPEFIEQTLRPQLEALQDQLPELREKYTAEVAQRAPQLMDDAVNYLQTDLLPMAHDSLLDFVASKVDETLEQAEETIGRAVDEVIDTTKDSVAHLEDTDRFRRTLEEAFEEQMGEVLDVMFTDLDESVAEAGRGMSELVVKMDAGTLQKRDMLELRAIQVTRALFTSLRESVPESEGEDLLQQLMGKLKELKIEAPARRTIRLDVMEGGVPDLSHIPEELREDVRRQILETQRAGAAPGAPPSDMPPEALLQIQEEQRKQQEAARAAGQQ